VPVWVKAWVKTVREFPRILREFSKNIREFSKNTGRFFMKIMMSTMAMRRPIPAYLTAI
jgi:hypothetical protein